MRRLAFCLVTLILLLSAACTRSASKAEPTETLTFGQAMTKTALYKPTETPPPTFTPVFTATATPKPTDTPVPTATPFALDDVNEAHPRWEDIKAVVEAGAMGLKESCAGFSLQGRLFCPDEYVSKGDVAVYICRAIYNESQIPVATGTFRDVDHKANPKLAACLEQLLRDKVLVEVDDKIPVYHPNRYMTTAEGWAYFLRGVHGSGWDPPPSTGIYYSCHVGVWYGGWCEAFINEGFYDKSLGRPTPTEKLTRAEAATIIRSYLETDAVFKSLQ